MNIRLANAADIPSILELVRRSVPLMRATGNLQWDDTYPNAKVFLNDIALDQLWLIEVDASNEADANHEAGSRPAAVAAITTEQPPEYAQLGWDISETAIVVHRLVVDPAVRGKGLATQLMQHAEVVARQRGLQLLRVDTGVENEATQKLFPKLGYTFAGEIGLSYRPGLRVLGYEKRLT